MISQQARLAGILLVVLPTVLCGGVSLLMMLIDPESGYMATESFSSGACPRRRVARTVTSGPALRR